MEPTVAIPCLNEAKTVAICVSKAVRLIEENSIEGEGAGRPTRSAG